MAVLGAFASDGSTGGGYNGNPLTISGMTSGAAAADRISVAAIIGSNRGYALSVTINGIAATLAVRNTNNGTGIQNEIWFCANPTGTTADVVVNYANSFPSSITVALFAVTGANLTPSDTDSAGTTGVNSISISGLTIPADGLALFIGGCGDQASPVSWTNATEHDDDDRFDYRFSAASSSTPGTPTVTFDGGDGSSHVLCGMAWAPSTPATVPTYFGSASVPADGASAVNATTQVTITPPASMLAGDLVVVSCVSGASNTWSNGVTGGQTWTAETAYQGTAGPWCRLFWCTFNGTWGANPRFDSTVGTNTSAIMHVFRPSATTKVWAIDVAQATTQYSAPDDSLHGHARWLDECQCRYGDFSLLALVRRQHLGIARGHWLDSHRNGPISQHLRHTRQQFDLRASLRRTSRLSRAEC